MTLFTAKTKSQIILNDAPKWPHSSKELLSLFTLSACLFSIAFILLSTFLTVPPDSETYALIGSSQDFGSFVTQSLHFGYYYYNILIHSLSKVTTIRSTILIVIVNTLCSYLSLYFVIRYFDLVLSKLNSHSSYFFYVVPNDIRTFMFLLAPLSGMLAWLPYNLKDSQLAALFSALIYSICFLFENILVLRKITWKVSLYGIILIASLLYGFTLRSYQTLLVVLIGLLCYLFIPLVGSFSLKIKFRLLRFNQYGFVSYFLSFFILGVCLLFFSGPIFSIVSEFNIASLSTVFFNFVKFIWGPLFWQIDSRYPLLYITTFFNFVLWILFLFLLVRKSIHSFRRKFCLMSLFYMFAISLPYSLFDTQVGPRYRLFAEIILYVSIVYALSGRVINRFDCSTNSSPS